MKYIVLEYTSGRAVVGEFPKEIEQKIIDATLIRIYRLLVATLKS